ncbi:MAG: hypothetical protein H0X41_05320 [Chitinophagaceae bacterium]|nr:hypothetical protein [Chitinophagaceae bacterium]
MRRLLPSKKQEIETYKKIFFHEEWQPGICFAIDYRQLGVEIIYLIKGQVKQKGYNYLADRFDFVTNIADDNNIPHDEQLNAKHSLHSYANCPFSNG